MSQDELITFLQDNDLIVFGMSFLILVQNAFFHGGIVIQMIRILLFLKKRKA